MTSVEEHYEKLLASHYTWMCGGHERNVLNSKAFFEKSGVAPGKCRKALDLGCGSGFQSLALAELGFDVVAVDSSPALVCELRDRQARQITVVGGDMRERSAYEKLGPFDVAVCMGDSLTHLQSFGEVVSL